MAFCLKFIFILLLAAACSRSKISVKSRPSDAKVYIRTLGQDDQREIGSTPIDLENDLVSELKGTGSDLKILYIEKKGYLPKSLILPSFGSSDAELEFKLDQNNYASMIGKIDSLGNELFKAQKLISRGSFSESINILKLLYEKYPSSSLISELLAGAHYLANDYENSLLYYEQSYKNDSQNVDAFKMIQYLENKMGVERPQLVTGESQ